MNRLLKEPLSHIHALTLVIVLASCSRIQLTRHDRSTVEHLDSRGMGHQTAVCIDDRSTHVAFLGLIYGFKVCMKGITEYMESFNSVETKDTSEKYTFVTVLRIHLISFIHPSDPSDRIH